MVHNVLGPDNRNYTLLDEKQNYSCCNVLVIVAIFLLGFTSFGLLAYNFFETAVSQEKSIYNVKVPWPMHWIWLQRDSNAKIFQSTVRPNDQYILVCYYEKKKNNHSSSPRLTPKNVDPHLCTHIIIGFASVVNCTLDLGEDLTIYKEMVELKKFQPNLKVMVSVGGAENESGFPQMVLNHANRKIFIRSVLNATKSLDLDGLDLDWEFPAWATKDTRDKIHFVQLAYELRKEFDKSSQNLVLSAAVAAPKAIIDQSYQVPELAEHVDFINLMSYDYHFYIWYYPVTDLNSPLYPWSLETGYLTWLNVNFSANYWVTKGMPKDKIVIGIPFYGHSYKLYNPSNHKLQAPARGFGDAGIMGVVTYPEVCNFLKTDAVRVFVNESYVPYLYKNNEWISYDDVTSVAHKAMWIKSNGFKGAMLFSLNTDDWNSTCEPNYRFPLTNVVKNIFNLKPY